MVLLWTAGITFFLKDYFDLPRPFHVDNTLELLDGKLPDGATFEFSKRGAKSFWEVLPADVVKATRQSEDVKNGFPSGHSSIAIAFCNAVVVPTQDGPSLWVFGTNNDMRLGGASPFTFARILVKRCYPAAVAPRNCT